MNTFIFLLGF